MAIAEKIKSAWANRYTRYGSIAVVLVVALLIFSPQTTRTNRNTSGQQRCL
jgi:hypothetical protein